MTGYVMALDPRPAERLKLDASGMPLPPSDLEPGAAVSFCFWCSVTPLHQRCSGCPRPRGLQSVHRNEEPK